MCCLGNGLFRPRTACRMADVCNGHGSSRMQWCQQVRCGRSLHVPVATEHTGVAVQTLWRARWQASPSSHVERSFVCVVRTGVRVLCSRSHVAEGHDADQDAAKRERNGRVRHRIVRVDAALEVIDAIVAHVGWDCGELLLCCVHRHTTHNTQWCGVNAHHTTKGFEGQHAVHARQGLVVGK